MNSYPTPTRYAWQSKDSTNNLYYAVKQHAFPPPRSRKMVLTRVPALWWKRNAVPFLFLFNFSSYVQTGSSYFELESKVSCKFVLTITCGGSHNSAFRRDKKDGSPRHIDDTSDRTIMAQPTIMPEKRRRALGSKSYYNEQSCSVVHCCYYYFLWCRVYSVACAYYYDSFEDLEKQGRGGEVREERKLSK